MTTDYSYQLRETLVHLEGVSKCYDGVPVLRDVNLEIKNLVRPDCLQGQVVALLGPSGMGKTTLFRVLAGLETPDSGQVLMGIEQKTVRRGQIGVVAQHYPLFAHRTVQGNLMVAGKQVGLKGKAGRDKANDLLERFGMSAHADKYPAQLSGGQRQRAAIAQQFMCSEGFLLMDEPFSGLDILAQETLIRFIHDIVSQDELMTFILITHDISAALQIADTVWVLGRDRDESGNAIAGGRVQASFNLIERGLAWHENIAALPQFGVLRQEIRDLFPRL
ncbi:ABC transporter ATP-binding protein [bacterium]|nr:MAG: ABC transporter ATP-binding protein [bacterium]